MAQNEGEAAAIWIIAGLFAIVVIVLLVDHVHKPAHTASAPPPVTTTQPASPPPPAAPSTDPRNVAVAAAAGDPNLSLPQAPPPPPEGRIYGDMRDALRGIVTSQEMYFAETATAYATDVRQLRSFDVAPGVKMQIRNAGPQGYAAIATDDRLPGKSCAVFVGGAAPVSPAKLMGQIRCTNEDE